MKITICGSMHFAKEMLENKKTLEEIGHIVNVAPDTQKFIDEPNFTTDNHEEDYNHAVENDIIRKHFNLISGSEAILVLNYPKNGIDGYIGGCVLMEIGLAYYLKKKIFLLYPPSSINLIKYSHEILIMQPIILNGDLTKIG
jgi:hypothetical protein